jgi:hypothetical protein
LATSSAVEGVVTGGLDGAEGSRRSTACKHSLGGTGSPHSAVVVKEKGVRDGS